MFKSALVSFLVFVITGFSAYAEEPACDIKIEFGSYSYGIDAASYQKIMQKIAAMPDIQNHYAQNLGLGGERTLCVLIKPDANLDKVYAELKNTLPSENRPGWVKITSRTGTEFQTPPTKTDYSFKDKYRYRY